ncbi:MAG: aldehyde dehydrogenase [Lachnospiraceae bacterium]|jgi:glyceraldehyde 3-phosphate dehydrogenase|nr:aldehyde dehydrogenase [Lachnospiraceae bacterium]
MKKQRVLINGLGRIGRAILRINLQQDAFELVAVNDINPDNKNIAYLIKYDSTYGRLPNEIGSDDRNIYIDGKSVKVFHESAIKDVDFTDIDVVIDASGIKANSKQIEEMESTSSVKKFIITNVDLKSAKNIIFGVNQDKIEESKVLSSSICDVVSLGPVYSILKKNLGIQSGFLTTLHPWLSYQNLLDGPAKSWSQPGDVFSHYALGRSSVMSLIPKSTSAIRALSNVYPEAYDKISSFSYRTPNALVASAVLTVLVEKNTTKEEIIKLLEDEEAIQKYHIIQTTDEPLISLDYIQNDYSVIIDKRWIQVSNNNHLEIVYWYDNEWGYSSRIVDIVKYIGEKCV